MKRVAQEDAMKGRTEPRSAGGPKRPPAVWWERSPTGADRHDRRKFSHITGDELFYQMYPLLS